MNYSKLKNKKIKILKINNEIIKIFFLNYLIYYLLHYFISITYICSIFF